MYLDKRDENGQLLSFLAFPISLEIAEEGAKIFSKSKVFNILTELLPRDLTLLLFKKIIFEEVFETSSKMLIAKYERSKINTIETSFELIDILKKNRNFKDFIIHKKNKFNYKNIRKFYSNFLWQNYYLLSLISKILNHNNNNTKTEGNKIAVNFLEDIDLKNRSNFFWYDKKIFSKKVIIYSENSYRLKKRIKDKKKFFKKLEKMEVNYMNLYSLKNFKKNQKFENIRKKLNELKVNNEERYFKKNALIYLSKIQYMYNFFKENKIKVHLNCEESGDSNILRQIAINLCDGCSFGGTRSYPTQIKGDFLGFHPNDIFFAWGEESAKRISETENLIKKIVITGDHYPKINKEKEKKLSERIEKLKKNNIKFLILVLDSSFSENRSFTWQLVYKKKMEKFFEKLLGLAVIDPEIGFIIKSKKKNNLKSLSNIHDLIRKLEKNNQCIFLNERNDLPSHYSSFTDITVSISPHIQGALFQCLINDKNFRGVIYDDSNLQFIEKDLYFEGENQLIFRNFDLMIKKIRNFKTDFKAEPELGKWNKPQNHDPFMDGKGGKRVGNFINNLINFYDQGFSTNFAIEKTIKNYINNYNKDKIYDKK
jgi:hypothetical protein